jgi:hypothetical protein
MTKYILAGGNDRHSEDYGIRLAEEVHKTIDKVPKILSCFFADSEPSQWELRAKDWEPWFSKYFGDDIAYEYAKPDIFIKQIKESDFIYLHGGDNEAMLARLNTYPGLDEAFQGKVVLGSSAGANYLAQKFWTRSKQQVMEGSGILPVNVMVHYGSKDGGFDGEHIDWPDADAKMQAVTSTGGELLRIREGQFVVINL